MLVSVVIPVLNEADQIGLTVHAARQDYGPDQVELVVVDGGSDDGTPSLLPPGVQLLHAPRGRAVQMNRGAAAASGDVLLFCHGDTRLPEGWRQAVVDAVDRPGVAGGTFSIRFLPARGILHLCNRLPLPPDWRVMYGDQAQFMSRETFARVGRYPEIPLMEDLEMMRRLRRVGRLVRLPLRVTTSSRRFLECGPLRQLGLDAVLVVRYLVFGAAPETLARDYRTTRRDRVGDGGTGYKAEISGDVEGNP